MTQLTPKVLLVDDVEANLIALRALLVDIDYELVCANSGNEALKHLLKHEFAVVLLDVQMPEMDGYEVASYARQNPATRDVPIIFVTAMHHNEENVLQGYGSGAVDFLFKPINPHVLRAKVRVFVELYTGRRKLADEVTAHQKTLESLRLANDALRHFTTAASHDLRAPLRTIGGFLDALAEELGERIGAQALHYLTRSRGAATRMNVLLDSLLGYARLQRPVTCTRVDCTALIDQVRSDLNEQLTTANVELESTALPSLYGDEGRLYQLFLNLINNAIKFHRRDGEPRRIAVSAEVNEVEDLICFADNGIGIDPDQQKKIFDAFARLHSAAAYEGSGLGLAICKEIVEQHGGRIWVESQVSSGSRFYVAFPHRS
jgi:signal transduction histidine kinase